MEELNLFLLELLGCEDPKVISSKDESDEALGEPLLRSEVDEFGDQLSAGLMRMATPSPGGSDTSNIMLSAGPMTNPVVRRVVFWLLQLRTAADALPSIFEAVVTSGKLSGLAFVGIYGIFVALWFPFWLLSLIITEWGVYAMVVGLVFLIGRSIIRLIAFPGSSHKVSSEIENEFAKYSVRMLISSSNSIVDLASAILSTSKAGADSGSSNSNYAYYEIPGLWKRAKSHRDRVLAVYAEVLTFIFEHSDESSNSATTDITKYGNNRLAGDIGDLSGLTPEARIDGKELLKLLNTVLGEIDRLEKYAKQVFEAPAGSSAPKFSNSAQMTATSLVIAASELTDFVESLKPVSAGDSQESSSDIDEEELTVDAVRRRFEEQSGSSLDAVKSGAAAILPMLDPPPHSSIFGFDVQRGCMLSRYRGARQLWVPRPGGGMIDVLHIPAKSTGPPNPRNPKAVLYCNPNAGLIEVATGMSLAGGNVASDAEGVVNDNCWADFYTNLGYDVFLFNYAGFGRSYGTASCGMLRRGGEEVYHPGLSGRLRRICHGTFFSFQPTPDSLRADGLAVGTHLVSHLGVKSLVIHGESIGGVAASGAAAKLTESPFLRDKVSLLICDRTFTNLEAVAQRLVGGWSGYAIRALAPFWSTDVAGYFLAANCPKVVANDSADAIIADTSSLKSGIAFWKEVHRGAASTKGIGWIIDAPVEYRMADWENVCVNDSRYVQSSFKLSKSPVWPADKHITLEEAFHFAACVKRIGKLASIEKKRFAATSVVDEETGGDFVVDGCRAPMFLVWKIIGCCDGLCGSALGMAVRGGFDCTVAWLCSTLTFGGQTVIESVEHRLNLAIDDGAQSPTRLGEISPKDFDCRPPGYDKQESETVVHPKPIPEVVESIRKILEENPNDEILKSVSHELAFVIGTFEYVVARLSSSAVVESSWKNRHLQKDGTMMVGSFMNLHCGHNNAFASVERKRLKTLLSQSASSIPTTSGSA